MAEVFEAYLEGENGFARRFALKRPHKGTELQHLAAFADEARILSQLDHPGIVSIFDFGTHEGWPYQLLEFVDGLDLSGLCEIAHRRGDPISTAHALRLIASTSDALHYAHQAIDWEGRPLGIVHRDVSPQNILVSWHGDVKVIDFGIAIANGRLAVTQSGVVKGKLSFMAPEQLTGKRVTPATDVFSLGCVLHYLLAGESPFLVPIRVPSAAETIAPNLLPEVKTLIRAAVATEPGQRFRTAKELGAACHEVLQSIEKRGEERKLKEWLCSVHERSSDFSPVIPPPLWIASSSSVDLDDPVEAETQANLDFDTCPPTRLSSQPERCGRFVIGPPVELGVGVYEAHDPGDNSPDSIAIRLFDSDLPPSEIARIFADAARVSALDHDHVIRVLEFGQAQDQLFIVTALPPGRSLRQVLDADLKPGAFDGVCAAAILIGMIRGLIALRESAARPRGAIRDIRPETVLITHDGLPKLIDVLANGPIDLDGNTDRAEVQALAACFFEMVPSGLDGPLDQLLADLLRAGDSRSLKAVQQKLSAHVEEKAKRTPEARIAELMLAAFGDEAALAQAMVSRNLRAPSYEDPVPRPAPSPVEPTRIVTPPRHRKRARTPMVSMMFGFVLVFALFGGLAWMMFIAR